jgi:hypothetical protein
VSGSPSLRKYRYSLGIGLRKILRNNSLDNKKAETPDEPRLFKRNLFGKPIQGPKRDLNGDAII